MQIDQLFSLHEQELESKYTFNDFSYNPPEEFYDLPYFGEDADLWASGLVLFMMLSGRRPFENPDDPKYKLFQSAPLKFWESQKLHKNAKFSKRFRDLINRMLADSPKSRLLLSEVRESKWMIGKMASKQVVFKEMTKRWIKIKKKKRTNKM